ncbi:MAG: excinuclease ABC subunit B [Verrucomicrobiaceae bacterium]|jgi:protein arginine kinase activator|nr:excinuclease ABC subunit B [Verrucomicrobiaceae bacterium]
MKCDVCEAEATVFLTQIINGQMTTVNLCEACSKAKGVTEVTGFGLAEAFVGAAPRAMETAPDLACPSCGFTAAQLKKIGRMGCPECYDTFREGLEGLLRGMHKGTRHVGKRPSAIIAAAPPPRPRRSTVPASTPPAPAIQTPSITLKEDTPAPPPPDLNKLRAELDLAVKEERYEDAATIKAEIDRQTQSSPPK